MVPMRSGASDALQIPWSVLVVAFLNPFGYVSQALSGSIDIACAPTNEGSVGPSKNLMTHGRSRRAIFPFEITWGSLPSVHRES